MIKLNGDYKNQLQIPSTIIQLYPDFLEESNNSDKNIQQSNYTKIFLNTIKKYCYLPKYNEKYSLDPTTDKIQVINKTDEEYLILLKLDLCTNMINYNLQIIQSSINNKDILEKELKKRIPRLEKLVEKSLEYLY